jgi:Ni/Co efflux regulator RcnB
MKTLLISMTAAALVVAAPTAFADNGQRGPFPGYETGQSAHGNRKASHPGAPSDDALHRKAGDATRRDDTKAGRPAHLGPEGKGPAPRGATGGRPAGNPMHMAPAHGQDASRGAHGTIDLHAYRRNITAQHRFRVRAYHAPHGYSYRRWSYGQRLPAPYFGRNYWIGDYYRYHLMVPPAGYVWVRFGPDALLVHIYSGEIIQVMYGLFY